MPLAKCDRCDTLFDKIKTPICLGCMPEEEAEYELVRDKLVRHPDVSAERLAELAEVEVKVVKRMLDAGLISSSVSAGEVSCGRCGAPAISHAKKLCDSCLDDLNRGVSKQREQLAMAVRNDGGGGGIAGDFVSVRQMIDRKRR